MEELQQSYINLKVRGEEMKDKGLGLPVVNIS